jgi:hypothetical protein
LQARLPHSHILAGYYESELGLWQLQSVNVLIASGFYFDDPAALQVFALTGRTFPRPKPRSRRGWSSHQKKDIVTSLTSSKETFIFPLRSS